MPQATPAAAQQTASPNQSPAQAAQPTQAEILAADNARRVAIRAEFAPFAQQQAMAELQRKCEDDTNCTAPIAAQRILAAMAKDVTPIGATHIQTIEDETDKRRDNIAAAIMARAGVADQQTRVAANGSQYRASSLLDIARDCLARAGIRTDGMDKMALVKAAFTQTTSDFPVLLENVMHKTLQTAYALQADTWSRFCATGSVSDFRDHPRYRVGSLGNLRALTELGEFENETIPDGEKSRQRAGTKGYVINLSRQAIINDDLGSFVGLAAAAGRAARRTIEADVYALLALNAGLGPVMDDGFTLYHASHGNIGTNSALTVAGIDADRVLMGSQTDVGGNDFLDLRPAVLLVPLGLGGAARVINQAQYDVDDKANKAQMTPNKVAGLFRDIVDSPRLSGTRRYAFADPLEAPAIEVAFLDGNSTPYLESETGFTVDGTRWKVRLDYGVAAVDYRGTTTNAGTA